MNIIVIMLVYTDPPTVSTVFSELLKLNLVKVCVSTITNNKKTYSLLIFLNEGTAMKRWKLHHIGFLFYFFGASGKMKTKNNLYRYFLFEDSKFKTVKELYFFKLLLFPYTDANFKYVKLSLFSILIFFIPFYNHVKFKQRIKCNCTTHASF